MKIFNCIKKIVPRANKKGTEVRCDIYLEDGDEIKAFQQGIRAFKYSMARQKKDIRLYMNFYEKSPTNNAGPSRENNLVHYF